MRIIYHLICAMLLTSILTVSTLAADKAPPENGTWTGTIGNNNVMACFMRDGSTQTKQAEYFYLRYSKPIALVPDPGNQTLWFEDNIKDPTGIWTINVQDDRITGTWSNPAKTKALPISLNRFKTISSDYSSTTCSPEFDIFNPVAYPQVLEEKIELSKETPALNGRNYRGLSALGGAVKSVKLSGEGKVIAELNTLLLNELRAGISAYYECPTSGGLYSRQKGKNIKPDYMASVEPLFWNKQWISFVATVSGDCGGAHPFSNFSYSTWDLSTGRELNLWEWIKDSQKTGSASGGDDGYDFDKLNKIITQKAIKQRLAFDPKEADEENNCLDVIRDNNQYDIRLSKTGLIFTQVFPHVVYACTDDIEITYSELMPFLTKKGKKAVMTIQENGS
jgi:hypothetical protein